MEGISGSPRAGKHWVQRFFFKHTHFITLDYTLLINALPKNVGFQSTTQDPHPPPPPSLALFHPDHVLKPDLVQLEQHYEASWPLKC